MTKKGSGHVKVKIWTVDNRKGKGKLYLDKHTLNANLPLDIIKVCEMTKERKTEKEVILEITGKQYYHYKKKLSR